MEKIIDKLNDVTNALDRFNKDIKGVKKGRVYAELILEMKKLLNDLLNNVYGNGLETREHEEEIYEKK